MLDASQTMVSVLDVSRAWVGNASNRGEKVCVLCKSWGVKRVKEGAEGCMLAKLRGDRVVTYPRSCSTRYVPVLLMCCESA